MAVPRPNTVKRLIVECLLMCACLVLWTGCGSSQDPGSAPGDGRAPNIVLILADDLGWADLSIYGSEFHETPHLDGFAAEGMLFTEAYTAGSVCSPSRASVLTSHYPARLHMTDWIPGQGDEPHQPLLQVRDHNALPLDEVTLAEELGGAGYTTAHIGKWHLGALEPGQRPIDHGFDTVIGVNDYGSPPTYFWPYEGGDRDLEWLTATGEPGENLTRRLGEEAARFITEHRDRPFFLYLPFYAPHTPIEGEPELVAKYERKAEALGIREAEVFGAEGEHLHRRVQSDPGYAAMVETLDDAVGRVLRSLEENGLVGETIVIFLSDNGGLAVLERDWPLEPPTSNLPLRAGKGWLYEGGIRGPMMVRWPGAVEAGAVVDVPVITNDLLPTVLEVAGLHVRPEYTRDGLSLVDLLRGRDAPDRQELFWHYPHYHGSGHRPSGAIRSGDHKLIQWYEDDRVELYDVRADPGETVDLSRSMPELADRLRSRLGEWLDDVDAQMPAPNPAHPGHRGGG